VQRKFSNLFLAGIACILFFTWGCNKIDSTALGPDLIPTVDNVVTFADTLLIDAAREQLIDTTRLSRSENKSRYFCTVKARFFSILFWAIKRYH